MSSCCNFVWHHLRTECVHKHRKHGSSCLCVQCSESLELCVSAFVKTPQQAKEFHLSRHRQGIEKSPLQKHIHTPTINNWEESEGDCMLRCCECLKKKTTVKWQKKLKSKEIQTKLRERETAEVSDLSRTAIRTNRWQTSDFFEQAPTKVHWQVSRWTGPAQHGKYNTHTHTNKDTCGQLSVGG